MTRVTVLCGFLGAGKTTTLSHVLHSNDGVRVGVIANDVAAVNIDAQLVREITQDAAGRLESVALDNGCACCTASQDLVGAFEKLVLIGAQTSDSGKQDTTFDEIVIETTGVAEAGQMKKVMNEFPSVKNGRVSVSAVVTVVDSSAFLDQFMSSEALKDRPDLAGEEESKSSAGKRMIVDLLMEQVENADAVVLNKIDLLGNDSTRIRRLREIIGKLNPNAKIYATSHGVVDLFRIADDTILEPARGDQHDHRHDDDHHGCQHGHSHSHASCGGDTCTEHKDCDRHGKNGKDQGLACCGLVTHADKYGIRSFVFKSDKPFVGPKLSQNVLQKMAMVQKQSTLPAFANLEGGKCNQDRIDQDVLSSKEENPFATIIRSKGFLFLQGPQAKKKMYWSHAGRHFQVTPQGEWEEERPRQELVFIGINLDEAAITRLLNDSLS